MNQSLTVKKESHKNSYIEPEKRGGLNSGHVLISSSIYMGIDLNIKWSLLKIDLNTSDLYWGSILISSDLYQGSFLISRSL